MTAPQNLKHQVREVLRDDDRRAAVDRICRHRARRVINALIARFYDGDPLIRWRAIAAAGAVVSGLAESDRESARVIMRRLMWMLNDESGGIGWGAPETMGEIMAQSRVLADEYADILCSYIHPAQNYLEHPVLQRGLLWGLGRLAGADPGCVKAALPQIASFLESEDPYHRAWSAWVLGNAGAQGCLEALSRLAADKAEIEFFDDWHLQVLSVGEMVRQAASKLSRQEKEG